MSQGITSNAIYAGKMRNIAAFKVPFFAKSMELYRILAVSVRAGAEMRFVTGAGEPLPFAKGAVVLTADLSLPKALPPSRRGCEKRRGSARHALAHPCF